MDMPSATAACHLEVLPEEVSVLALKPVINLLVKDTAALVVNGNPVTCSAVGLGVHLLQPHSQCSDVLEIDVEE